MKEEEAKEQLKRDIKEVLQKREEGSGVLSFEVDKDGSLRAIETTSIFFGVDDEDLIGLILGIIRETNRLNSNFIAKLIVSYMNASSEDYGMTEMFGHEEFMEEIKEEEDEQEDDFWQ